MPDSLESARIKLERANLHARIARREARRFFSRQSDPVFAIEPYGDPSDGKIGSTFGCMMVVEKGWPDLPQSFSARFGDAIHNYRCVLDHIAWQLVMHGLCPPNTLTERGRRLVQFPIYDAEQAFDEQIARRLPGVDLTALDFIKARHEYIGGQATNNDLCALARLSNDDKHRTLTIIASVFANAHTQVTFTDCELVSAANPATRPTVKDGAVVLILECRITGADAKVGVQLRPTLHIALEDGSGFGDVLADLCREVEQVLNAPEIVAAVR